MITFDNVTKMYDGNVGLENASIHIDKGDFVFLVGPSGAGKSTFIKLILKEINADSGSIIVDGQEVTRLSSREIPKLRRRIGIVFQDFRLLNKKTVFENVAFAMEAVHESRHKIKERVPQVLKIVGIDDQADKYPSELSAGEQQRVAIARAIINGPKLLIADEPTGNLDPETAYGIMELLEEINETGTTVVMVTHARDIVDRMQKRVVAIDGGHIVRDETGDYGFDEEDFFADSTFEPVPDEDEEEELRIWHKHHVDSNIKHELEEDKRTISELNKELTEAHEELEEAEKEIKVLQEELEELEGKIETPSEIPEEVSEDA